MERDSFEKAQKIFKRLDRAKEIERLLTLKDKDRPVNIIITIHHWSGSETINQSIDSLAGKVVSVTLASLIQKTITKLEKEIIRL